MKLLGRNQREYLLPSLLREKETPPGGGKGVLTTNGREDRAPHLLFEEDKENLSTK